MTEEASTADSGSSSRMHQFECSVGQWQISGTSISGHYSCVAVANLGVAFDIGCLFNQALGCDLVCVTHGHADHIAALPQHSRIRAMRRDKPATYVVPRQCELQVKQLWAALYSLDNDQPDGFVDTAARDAQLAKSAKIVCASLDTPMALPKRRVLRCFATEHRVPSVAYCVCETKSVLKEEYRGLPNDTIATAAKSGKQVSDKVVVPVLAYTGDTTIKGLMQHKELLQCPTLIVECTIWDDSVSRDETANRGHIHFDDLNALADVFENDFLCLTHVSPRHSLSQVTSLLNESRLKRVFEARGAQVVLLR